MKHKEVVLNKSILLFSFYICLTLFKVKYIYENT